MKIQFRGVPSGHFDLLSLTFVVCSLLFIESINSCYCTASFNPILLVASTDSLVAGNTRHCRARHSSIATDLGRIPAISMPSCSNQHRTDCSRCNFEWELTGCLLV